MNAHPGKLSFQFTQYEVMYCDFNRFKFLFGSFERLPSHELPAMLRDFCGALTITFDPLLKNRSASPLEHPSFHLFAKQLMEQFSILPFLLNLDDEAFMLLFFASFARLTTTEIEGAPLLKIAFDGPEFSRNGILAKDNAGVWAEKAGMDSHQIHLLRMKVQTYLKRTIVPDQFGW